MVLSRSPVLTRFCTLLKTKKSKKNPQLNTLCLIFMRCTILESLHWCNPKGLWAAVGSYRQSHISFSWPYSCNRLWGEVCVCVLDVNSFEHRDWRARMQALEQLMWSLQYQQFTHNARLQNLTAITLYVTPFKCHIAFGCLEKTFSEAQKKRKTKQKIKPPHILDCGCLV